MGGSFAIFTPSSGTSVLSGNGILSPRVHMRENFRDPRGIRGEEIKENINLIILNVFPCCRSHSLSSSRGLMVVSHECLGTIFINLVNCLVFSIKVRDWVRDS